MSNAKVQISNEIQSSNVKFPTRLGFESYGLYQTGLLFYFGI
jgi:hypothetical protein